MSTPLPKPSSLVPQVSSLAGSLVANARSLEEVRARRAQLKEFVNSILVPNVDYGVIPGTDKNTLLKPGAENLCQLYNLAPTFTYEKEVEDFGSDAGPLTKHEALFYYRVKCSLVHLPTGQIVGEGIGSANSHEKKYRYRKEYWNNRREEPPAAQGWQRASGRDGVYFFRNSPNPDIADSANTILKMALKRAQIDATLRATATSEIFGQDMEDDDGSHAPATAEAVRADATAPAKEKPKPKGPPLSPEEAKAHAELRAKFAAAKTVPELEALADEVKKAPKSAWLRPDYKARLQALATAAASTAKENAVATKEATAAQAKHESTQREPGDDAEEGYVDPGPPEDGDEEDAS